MLTPLTLTLILNSLTLTVALGLLLLLLWYDAKRITNLAFSWFLVMVLVWSSGSILSRGAAFAGADDRFITVGLHMVQIGFAGAALALYLYVIILTGNRSRRLIIFGVLSNLALLVYFLALILIGGSPSYQVTVSGLLQYDFDISTILAFGVVNIATLVIVWQGFRRIQRPALAFGVMLFCLGQLVALTSPRLRLLSVAEDAGAIATMVMAFSLVQTQIIQPLAGQTRQIGVVRDVGLAITSRLRLQNTLQAISAQAAALLDADASLIFLRDAEGNALILAAQYNIHENLLGHRLGIDEGVSGQVVKTRSPALFSDYRAEWRGRPDTPFAEEGFGSVIAVPLVFADDAVGVLLVINGLNNRIFDHEDVQLLELLAPQAAVAITNSRLFEQQRGLTDELEVAKTRLEAFLSSTDNPVVALNRDFEIIFANDSAISFIEDSLTVIGRRLDKLVPADYLPKDVRRVIRDIRRTKSHIYEIEVQNRTFLCHVATIREPERGWIAVLNDVSSLKELERLQRQMIELTTHQLKNPLQGAMLHLDELEDLGQDVLTDDMRYDMAVISEQLERMQMLIEGIMNLERLQNRGERQRERIDFAAILAHVISSLRDQAEKKFIALQADIEEPLPSVMGNFEELREAISNLVDNAIKYTPQKGTVSVQAMAENGHVHISVRDNGIGIPLADQSRVFERFYRVDQSGMEQVGGTGMGLSLVKAIVESHDGQIQLQSEQNHGTTFTITLPVAELRIV